MRRMVSKRIATTAAKVVVVNKETQETEIMTVDYITGLGEKAIADQLPDGYAMAYVMESVGTEKVYKIPVARFYELATTDYAAENKNNNDNDTAEEDE